MSLLSIGSNRKLGKKVGIFNLPPGRTCPGKTAECAQVCYANKASRCYKSARQHRETCYEASLLPGFEALIVAEIIVKKIKQVRIHEAGDFYSQEYLDKWVRITTFCPDTTFLAFTKSFHLDFSQLPPNVKLFYSLDTTTTAPVPGGKNTALTLPKGVKTGPAGVHVCTPVGKATDLSRDKEHYHYCGEACTYCWENKGDVAWIRH
jgi:hypothetical protein